MKKGYIVCAFALVAMLLSTLVASHYVFAQAPNATRPENGRFQVQGSGPNIFLVDTQIGKTWLSAEIPTAGLGDFGNRVWLPQDRIDNVEQLKSWFARHPKTN